MKFAALGLPAVLRPKLIAISTFALLAASSASNAFAQVAAAQWNTSVGVNGTAAAVSPGQSFDQGNNSNAPGLIQTAASGPGLVLSSQAWVGNYLGDPTAWASASVQAGCSNCAGNAVGNASFAYTVEILGPAGPVPLQVNAFGGTQSSNGPSTYAYAILALGGSGLGGADYYYSGNFVVQGTLQAYADVPFAVQGSANAVAYAGPVGSSSAASFAYVDPYFSIDPSFPDASLYSIVVSAGVGNSAITPGLPAPGPAPGAGVAGLVFLMLAGVANRTRGFLLR